MSDTDFIDEEQIFFKRFPAEKQDQVRGLVNYATLMGLTGKDLVSIGGKLDRLKASQELQRNKEILNSIDIHPIGGDKSSSSRQDKLDHRFKIKTTNGQYNFESDGYDRWRVTSLATKVVKTWQPKTEDGIPKTHWRRRLRYAMMLDVAHGYFQLNF